jgi:hypothetical protein
MPEKKANSCRFCEKTIENRGSLASHELCCNNNPNKVKRKRSPEAGQKKGCVAWNKGKKFTESTIKNAIEKIESGEYKKFCEDHIRTLIKCYLIQKHGHKCMKCGLSEWLGEKMPLVCDHIDGNSSNNELSNTRIICNNCDSISSTFKGRNRGNGRKNRYKKLSYDSNVR